MNEKYPEELRQATRAEYVTIVRVIQKAKPRQGCFSFVTRLLFRIMLLVLFGIILRR
jgi:hypothetical protein